MTGNKTIVKNTAFLYFRILILMLVSLYTTRTLLLILGNEDFGLFNIVGSIIVLLSFLNSALISTTQRFLANALGSRNKNYEKVFQNCITLHIIIALVALMLAETIGLWFVNNKLNIPVERYRAMNFVYHCNVILFLLKILQVPYQASIIAHEQMNFYSTLGILEAILSLVLVLLLQLVTWDKLKAYALFLLLNGIIVFIINLVYCQRNFSGCKFGFLYTKKIFVNLLSFSSWYLLGSIAYLSMEQGGNILANQFWGVEINAALAIALKVNSAVLLFVSNFRQAVDPQIYKSFAQNDLERMFSLIFGSARSTFYLLLLLCIPLIFNIDYILHLWLKSPPEKSACFCQLALIFTLVQSFDSSFGSTFKATGNISANQILAAAVYITVLPVVYFLFENNFPVESLYYVKIVAAIIVGFIVKVFLLRFQLNVPLSSYYRRLILPISKVSAVLSLFLALIFLLPISNPFIKLVTITITNSLVLGISVFYFDFDEEMRQKVRTLIQNKLATSRR